MCSNSPVYCPACVAFGEDCNPESEDWNTPCPYYKDKRDEESEDQVNVQSFDKFDIAGDNKQCFRSKQIKPSQFN